MFLHGGLFHILFNMLALWMFGTELERIWGTRYFLKFYFVTGIGAGILTVLFSLLPFGVSQQLYGSIVIGASGAIYGLLLAYALYFPESSDLHVFRVSDSGEDFRHDHGRASRSTRRSPARAAASPTRRISAGCWSRTCILKSARMNPLGELKYRYLRWKINRVRKKFDVYSGGRADDWDRRVH